MLSKVMPIDLRYQILEQEARERNVHFKKSHLGKGEVDAYLGKYAVSRNDNTATNLRLAGLAGEFVQVYILPIPGNPFSNCG
jgi:hypothetical protein